MPTTPLYVGGGRRSAAPRITLAPTAGTAAREYDEELARQLFASFAPNVAAGAAPAPIAAPGGAVTLDFGGAGNPASSPEGGGPAGSAPAGMSPNTVGALGTGLAALGVLGQDSALGSIGGLLGLAGAMGSSTSNSQALGTFGQAALSAAGIPGAGSAINAVNGNVAGAINSALGLVSPHAAAINALMGLVTGQTLGSTTAPAASLGLNTISDALQIALGTAVNAFSPPNTPAQQAAISVVDMGPTSQGTTVGHGTQGTTPAMSGGFGTGAATTSEGFGFGSAGTDTGDDGTSSSEGGVSGVGADGIGF